MTQAILTTAICEPDGTPIMPGPILEIPKPAATLTPWEKGVATLEAIAAAATAQAQAINREMTAND